MNFKNAKAYHDWLAYGHIHHVFDETHGEQEITIHGRHHRVKHSR